MSRQHSRKHSQANPTCSSILVTNGLRWAYVQFLCGWDFEKPLPRIKNSKTTYSATSGYIYLSLRMEQYTRAWKKSRLTTCSGSCSRCCWGFAPLAWSSRIRGPAEVSRCFYGKFLAVSGILHTMHNEVVLEQKGWFAFKTKLLGHHLKKEHK